MYLSKTEQQIIHLFESFPGQHDCFRSIIIIIIAMLLIIDVYISSSLSTFCLLLISFCLGNSLSLNPKVNKATYSVAPLTCPVTILGSRMAPSPQKMLQSNLSDSCIISFSNCTERLPNHSNKLNGSITYYPNWSETYQVGINVHVHIQTG